MDGIDAVVPSLAFLSPPDRIERVCGMRSGRNRNEQQDVSSCCSESWE
jgi:hypothetical protein